MRRPQALNAANSVTLARMVMIPLFLVAILADWTRWLNAGPVVLALRPWVAAAVFTILAATDGVDGYLARSRNEVTTFGKFLDPLADKLLVTAALLALVELALLPTWIAFVIIAREFIVSGLRMVASAEGTVIAASGWGKLKTVLQIVAIIAFIVKDSSQVAATGVTLSALFQSLSWTAMTAAVIMTILSMIDYFRHAADVLIGPWSGPELGSIAEAVISAGDDAVDETMD